MYNAKFFIATKLETLFLGGFVKAERHNKVYIIILNNFLYLKPIYSKIQTNSNIFML